MATLQRNVTSRQSDQKKASRTNINDAQVKFFALTCCWCPENRFAVTDIAPLILFKHWRCWFWLATSMIPFSFCNFSNRPRFLEMQNKGTLLRKHGLAIWIWTTAPRMQKKAITSNTWLDDSGLTFFFLVRWVKSKSCNWLQEISLINHTRISWTNERNSTTRSARH